MNNGNDEAKQQAQAQASLKLNTLLTLPLVRFIGFAAACILFGASAREYMLRLTHEVETVTFKVGSVLDEVARLRKDLSEELNRRTADQMTRTDAKLWSYELERANAGKLIVPPLPRENLNR
jgi:hypothetical protein